MIVLLMKATTKTPYNDEIGQKDNRNQTSQTRRVQSLYFIE